MPFVARATKRIEVPTRVAFDCLVDHRSWSAWMPASFRPVGEAFDRLAVGQTFRARLVGSIVPTSCRVTVVDAPLEVTWCGGSKALVYAEHRFLFVPKGDDAVEVESHETWSGVVAELLRGLIQPVAIRVGKAQLQALHDEALRR